MSNNIYREIIEASVFLRTNNQTISSDTIEFMKRAAIEKLAGEVEGLPDLSKSSEDEKKKLIEGFTELVSKHALSIFLALGLKNFFECMVINEPTGEEYILSFRTTKDYHQKVKIPTND